MVLEDRCWYEFRLFFYKEASAYVRVDEELSESFPIGVGVRQGYVMSSWLFNIFCGWVYERNES